MAQFYDKRGSHQTSNIFIFSTRKTEINHLAYLNPENPTYWILLIREKGSERLLELGLNDFAPKPYPDLYFPTK